MIETIISQIWPYILGTLALVVGWVFSRHQGKQARDAQIAREEAQARKQAREVEDETAAMADDDVDRDLKRNWVRNRQR